MDGVFLFSFILLFRLVLLYLLLELLFLPAGWVRDLGHSIPNFISHHPLDFQFLTSSCPMNL
jgi:hypothetical protein